MSFPPTTEGLTKTISLPRERMYITWMLAEGHTYKQVLPTTPGVFMGEMIVVTVVGADKPGIVAAISSVLAEAKANIVDISMTVLRGFFSMIMVVDISGAVTDLTDLRDRLERKGDEVGVKVMVLHEDVFRYMQKI